MAKTVADYRSKTGLTLTNDVIIRVLHIDDDENALIITKRHLEKIGPFQVDSVLSVIDAYKNLEQKHYDVIISDYILPERNGLEFLKQLKSDQINIPFILFTGTSRKEVLIDALNLGAYRYFNKNENPDTLYFELAHSLKLASVINDYKKAETELKESETKFRAITAAAQDGIILIGNSGKIAYWNSVSEKIFGYTKKEAIGKNLHMLLAPNKIQDKILQGFTKFKQTGNGNVIGKTLELEGIHKDGKTVPIEISISALKLKEKWYALSIVRDNSERKDAWTSLEETINELIKINEKLNVVGRLTRHDARNKLAVILNNIYLAKRRIVDDQVSLGYLQSISLAVDQMKAIFEFASTYESVGIEELINSNVEQCFNEALILFSNIEQINVLNETKSLIVLADSLLRQLFYNLIHNSLVHGENVSEIKVSYKEDSNQLQLIYEDNGKGIANHEKQKICENYGWSISEKGIPGKGVKFVLTIPKNDNKGNQLFCFCI